MCLLVCRDLWPAETQVSSHSCVCALQGHQDNTALWTQVCLNSRWPGWMFTLSLYIYYFINLNYFMRLKHLEMIKWTFCFSLNREKVFWVFPAGNFLCFIFRFISSFKCFFFLILKFNQLQSDTNTLCVCDDQLINTQLLVVQTSLDSHLLTSK